LTGAAGICDNVNTPATDAGLLNVMVKMSCHLLYLEFDAEVPIFTPLTALILINPDAISASNFE